MSNIEIKHSKIIFPTQYTDWIIGLSGGVDSVVLLDLCLRYLSEHPVKHNLYPVHLNHQTRGKDSDNDEILCKKLCERHKLPIYTKQIDVRKIAQENQENFEEAARIERHKLFYELCNQKQLKSPAVLLAHHQGDQVETVLMRLLRGSGMRGLQGIKNNVPLPMHPALSSRQLQVFRPLLKHSKSSITEYALSRGLEWREDKSNSCIDYTRNLLRNIIIPALKVIDPKAESKLNTLSNISKRVEKEIEKEIENILFSSTKIAIKIEKKSAQEVSEAAFFRLVENLCSKIDPTFLLPKRAYSSLKDLISEKIRGTDIANDIHISEYHEWYYLFNKYITKNNYYYEALADNFKFISDNFSVKIKRTHLSGFIPDTENPKIEYIPISYADTLLRITNSSEQINITQIGLKGSQKLSKLLKNHHIPIHIRSQIPILYAGTEPLWVVGVALCEAAKLKEVTGEVFCLEYSEKTL